MFPPWGRACVRLRGRSAAFGVPEECARIGRFKSDLEPCGRRSYLKSLRFAFALRPRELDLIRCASASAGAVSFSSSSCRSRRMHPPSRFCGCAQKLTSGLIYPLLGRKRGRNLLAFASSARFAGWRRECRKAVASRSQGRERRCRIAPCETIDAHAKRRLRSCAGFRRSVPGREKLKKASRSGAACPATMISFACGRQSAERLGVARCHAPPHGAGVFASCGGDRVRLAIACASSTSKPPSPSRRSRAPIRRAGASFSCVR